MINDDKRYGSASRLFMDVVYYAFIGLALVYCLSNFPYEQVVHVYQQY